MVGDGPDLVDCVALARSLGVADDVQFLGEQDQVVPLLSAAHVFLLPSSQESFGLAALEAMACEVPAVASRIGGLPELVEDGVTGFLHDPNDLEGMARSAILLLTDEALHRRVAGSGAPSARKIDSATRRLFRSTRGTTARSSGVAAAAVTAHAVYPSMPRRTRPPDKIPRMRRLLLLLRCLLSDRRRLRGRCERRCASSRSTRTRATSRSGWRCGTSATPASSCRPPRIPTTRTTALLVMLNRGLGYRTALATATRGNGGQNEIGPEIFEALGVLRTEELAAHASLRRRRAVLHARGGFRLLVQHRRDVREVGTRRDHRATSSG